MTSRRPTVRWSRGRVPVVMRPRRRAGPHGTIAGRAGTADINGRPIESLDRSRSDGVLAREKPPRGGFLVIAAIAARRARAEGRRDAGSIGGDMAVDQALYRRTVLPSGLVVLTEPMDHVRTASLGVWIGAGSRHEEPARMGICHFIEHALFKGTRSRSALAIAQTMDAIGGHLNAFTDKEHTCYYLRVLSDHLDDAMAVLSDMLLDPAFDPDALERERQVILEEIHMYEDAPDDLVHDLFAASVWPDHPLGRPIAGVEQTVQALGRADLVAFMDAYCRPDAAIVAAAGRLEHEQIVELVQRWLGGWRGRRVPVEISPPAARTAVTLRNKEIEQVHLCLGGPGYPQAHEDRYALAVLDTALGGGMSSRLFQEIREERGLAYAVSTYHAAYQDVGAFVVYCGTSPVAAREVVRLVFDNLGRATNGLPAEEITRAKESLKGSLMLDLETPGSRMSKLARSEQYFGRQLTLDEIIADVDAVDADDVRRVATALFVPERMSLAAIGPFDAHGRLAEELRGEVRRYAGA